MKGGSNVNGSRENKKRQTMRRKEVYTCIYFQHAPPLLFAVRFGACVVESEFGCLMSCRCVTEDAGLDWIVCYSKFKGRAAEQLNSTCKCK